MLAAHRLAVARPKRVLRFVPRADLGILDPLRSTSILTRDHAFLVYDTLFGEDSASRPSPQMVEGYQVEADGRVWRPSLRPGLPWHDGERVLARDCVASIRRWAAKDAFGQALMAVVPALAGIGALRTDDAVFAHFATVVRESRLPICVYDDPGTTHFRFTPALVGRLGRVPGIVALKSPAPDAAEARRLDARLQVADTLRRLDLAERPRRTPSPNALAGPSPRPRPAAPAPAGPRAPLPDSQGSRSVMCDPAALAASELAWTAWSPFTDLFNLTQVPAISVPCGLTAAALPVGLQIVGPLRADTSVLNAAHAFECARPFGPRDAPRGRDPARPSP